MATRARIEDLPRAQRLADELDRRWGGEEACDEGPVIIEAVELVTSPTSWPPTFRISFRMDGRRGVWEQEWDSVLWSEGPISEAADMFASIAWTGFLEMQDTSTLPHGLRMLDD
jgi:hypothetical protein